MNSIIDAAGVYGIRSLTATANPEPVTSVAVDSIEPAGQRVWATSGDVTTLALVDNLVSTLLTYDAKGQILQTSRSVTGTRYNIVA